MAWIKVDDHFDENPKIAKAGPLGLALWVTGLAYCNRNLTDGFIPWSVARSLICWEYLEAPSEGRESERVKVTVTSNPHDEIPSAMYFDGDFAIKQLIYAGLWDVVDGGYQVHDYTDYQKTKAEINGISESKRVGGKARAAQTKHEESIMPANVEQDASIMLRARPNPNPKEEVQGTYNKTPLPPSDQSPVVNELFEHFKRKFGKPDMRLSQQQRQKLNVYLKRPKSRSVDELKKCLDNAAADNFYQTLAHKGIEFFIGNEGKVEQFLALVPRQQKPAYGSQPPQKPPEPGAKIFQDPDTGQLMTEDVFKARQKGQARPPVATNPRGSSGMAPIGSVLAGVKR